jgi:uncharacterized protein (UPF0333 family)
MADVKIRSSRKLLIIILLVVVIGVGSYFIFGNSNKTAGTNAGTISSTSNKSTVSSSVSTNGTKVDLGTNNPNAGDCTTNTSEASTSVGYVVLNITASSFQADVHLQTGEPNTNFGVFMQQVPGSCPQEQANGGTLTTDSTGSGSVVVTVPRVAGATTFFVQLVNGTINVEYTSDRI